jgi:hypothetical protein
VDPGTVAARSAELRGLAADKGAVYRARRDGARADVVLLRRAGGWFEGLTEDYLTVYTPTDRVVPARFGAVLRQAGDGTLQAEP